MSKPLDVVFINANAAEDIYQGLAKDYSAYEPPIWAGLMANHCRSRGFNVDIIDCEVLNMTDEQTVYHLRNMNPRLVAFSMYGQQPSASAQNMQGAVRLAERIKNELPNIQILFFGIYPSALPKKTMEDHEFIDFVCTGEGVYTISDLLKTDLISKDQLSSVKGLAYRSLEEYRGDDPRFSGGVECICINAPSEKVPQEQMAEDLPGVAWDLLPMRHYRTALWHALPNNAERQPFAALYTSLGCCFACSFCCINQPFGGSSFRWWTPEFIIEELDKLHKLGIVNIKFADEMWLLRADHFLRTCELIIERGYKFNIWAYARVDTIKNHPLDIIKKAGVNWLALGIESANSRVRKDVYKGRFGDTDIVGVVNKIREAGINVIGNYIFGLPEDDLASMQETLDLAIELNTEEANFYCSQAYPGSALYKQAVSEGWQLPENYAGYSQHSYYTQNLPSKYLAASQILKFRDEAWLKYHTNEKYLKLVLDKFGERAYNETIASTKIQLKRKLLEV
jgi:radical SAM superfamily enzyme YgiQ (UPF0313 family)